MSNGNNPERAEQLREIPPTNNLLAAIVAIIFLAVLGYFAFTYITGSENGTSIYEAVSDRLGSVLNPDDNEGNIISGSTQRNGGKESMEEGSDAGDVGDAGVDKNSQESVPTYDDGSRIIQWAATDYQPGDINTGEYTVKSGDTLWEISEAAYGSGTNWTTIRNANSGNIDYLPSGEQALIYAGQSLTIPQIN